MSKLRLVEVRVQPVFMLDDGETLEPVEHPVTVIPASEWASYSGERFPREVAAWQSKLDSGVVRDELPRDERGNHGTSEGHGNTIIEGP